MKQLVVFALAITFAFCSCSKQTLEPMMEPTTETQIQSYSIGLDIIAPEELESSSVTFYDNEGNSLSSRVLESDALRNGELTVGFKSKREPSYLVSPNGDGIVPIPMDAITKASAGVRVTLVLHL